MNPDNVFQSLQKGFHITLGAVSTLAESLQDSQKREETIHKLQTNPTLLTEELAQKGVVTEQEARSFVDSVLAPSGRSPQQPSPSASTGGAENTTAASSPAGSFPDLEQDLQALTAKLTDIRTQLEKAN